MDIRTVSEAPQESVKINLIFGPISRFVEKDGVGMFEFAVASADAKKPLSQRRLRTTLHRVISLAKQHKLRHITLEWSAVRKIADKSISDKKLGELFAIALHMAEFDFNVYKQEPKNGFDTVEAVHVVGVPKVVHDGMVRGAAIALEVNACRALANTPGGDMTPKVLAEVARTLAQTHSGLTARILGKEDMQKLGMGAVLGIAQGSAEDPQFIIMEYRGAAKTKKPVVLVGKGVTFDTGGLQIKPGDSMYEMHMDMSGGAAAIHAVALAARLKLKANVVALVPAVENAASGSAVRPGDMLRSLSGKTIEILHTDAEGRVILADAITYAKQFDPKIVVDVATLTGAALVALGTQASAIMTNREQLLPKLQTLGEESGDYVWPFPAWEEYEEMTKGTFGDVPNISTAGNSRYGGVIAGGMFLREFAKELDCPWVHIDMAPRMTSTPSEFLAKGAVGAPVRLLLAIIEEYGK